MGFPVPLEYSIETDIAASGGTTYELIVKDSSGSRYLMIAASKLKNEMSEAEYLDDIKNTLAAGSDTAYTFANEYSGVTIAGINYLCMHLTAVKDGVPMENDFYVRINEDIVSFLITRYNDSTRQQVKELLAGIKPLK